MGPVELVNRGGRSSPVVTNEASDLSQTLIQQSFCHQNPDVVEDGEEEE